MTPSSSVKCGLRVPNNDAGGGGGGGGGQKCASSAEQVMNGLMVTYKSAI